VSCYNCLADSIPEGSVGAAFPSPARGMGVYVCLSPARGMGVYVCLSPTRGMGVYVCLAQ